MMTKQFNITGACVPGKHYMVDISNKTAKIFDMITPGDYFVINRPRQFGKTTIIDMLARTEDEVNFLIENNKLHLAVNRIYYGSFYILSALALKYRFQTSKHGQTWTVNRLSSTRKILIGIL